MSDATTATIEGLKPFALLGGYTAVELWPFLNFILPTWLLLLLAPSWKWTPTLTLVGPIVFAAVYALSIGSLIGGGAEIDFSSFEGVVALFRDPNGVFCGWVHYLVYDALVGRWIALDSVKRGCGTTVHVLVMVPCLVLALMFAPMGWLLYLAAIRPFLPGSTAKTASKDKMA